MATALKREHFILLENAYWEFADGCEYGGPAVDCKRPFGNSGGIAEQMCEILGLGNTEGSCDYAETLFRQTGTLMPEIVRLARERYEQIVADQKSSQKAQKGTSVQAPTKTTVHIYVGLPGSGKTHLATSHHKTFGGVLLDDVFTIASLKNAITDGAPHVYITDPNLCAASTRQLAVDTINLFGVTDIRFYWFENDPEAAWANIEARAKNGDTRKFTPESMKNYWTKLYSKPSDCEMIPIWRA